MGRLLPGIILLLVSVPFAAAQRPERDNGEARLLRHLMHEVTFVPETMRGHQLLDLFVKHKRHFACVIDEYGGFEGVVTLEDVLERLLGSEIVDEHDRYPDMQQLARRRALELHPPPSAETVVDKPTPRPRAGEVGSR